MARPPGTCPPSLRLVARLLLSAINHGEFAINGFRNRDLRAIFFSQTTNNETSPCHSAWISRKLRLLRAHALITKITGTHRYQLTSTVARRSLLFSALYAPPLPNSHL